MKRFSNILFVASATADNSAALKQALALATNNQAQLTVVGVISDLGNISPYLGPQSSLAVLRQTIIDERQTELQELIEDESCSSVAAEYKVLVGNELIEIIREVLRYKRDLVIKSAEPISGILPAFSSLDMKLLRKCPCPLWIINSTQKKGFREVLAAVAYDPDDPQAAVLNGQILELATSIALADFAELHIVHAWRLEYESYLRSARLNNTAAEVDAMVQEEGEKRKRWIDGLIAKHCLPKDKSSIDYLKPVIHLPVGEASHEVPKLAETIGAELVVMGTLGRSGILGIIIGNTAETILQQISCSVLAVKPDGFVSPITLP